MLRFRFRAPLPVLLGAALFLAGCGAATGLTTPSPAPAGDAAANPPATTPPSTSDATPPAAPATVVNAAGQTVIVGTSIAGGPIVGPPLRDITPLPPGSGPGSGRVLTPDASGRVILTLPDEAGAAVTLAPGNRLELRLGSGYDWSVQVSDATLLTGSGPVAGAGPAVYQAQHAGRVTLSATADPLCRKANPPCGLATRVYDVPVTIH